MPMTADVAAVRRHLNRAIATSLTDAEYLVETTRLATSNPAAFLRSCFESALVDAEQAKVVCGLLAHVPSASAYCEPGSCRPVLLDLLHDTYGRANTQGVHDALLLLVDRLTTPMASPDGGMLKPLIERNLLVEAVLLPLLKACNDATSHKIILRTTYQTLSCTAPVAAHQSAEQPAFVVALPALLSLVDALLPLLDQQRMGAQRRGSNVGTALSHPPIGSEITHLILRCVHACVQLLLPRIATAADTIMSQRREWCRVLSWRSQLLAWSLFDRIRDSSAARGSANSQTTRDVASCGDRQDDSGGAGNAGDRLMRWIRASAQPPSAPLQMHCLVLAATVPSLPFRQALPQVVASLDHKLAAAAVAALASGLASGCAIEWQHAVSKIMTPLTQALAALRDPEDGLPRRSTLPALAMQLTAAADRIIVGSAHILLLAMLTQAGAHAAMCQLPANSAGETGQICASSRHAPVSMASESGSDHSSRATVALRLNDRQLYTERVLFAVEFSKWLTSALHSCNNSLVAAHLLGVTVRAAAECPCEVGERYVVVRLAAQQRLLTLRGADSNADLVDEGSPEMVGGESGPVAGDCDEDKLAPRVPVSLEALMEGRD